MRVPKQHKETMNKNKKKLTSKLVEGIKNTVKTRILDTMVKFLSDAMNAEVNQDSLS